MIARLTPSKFWSVQRSVGLFVGFFFWFHTVVPVSHSASRKRRSAREYRLKVITINNAMILLGDLRYRLCCGFGASFPSVPGFLDYLRSIGLILQLAGKLPSGGHGVVGTGEGFVTQVHERRLLFICCFLDPFLQCSKLPFPGLL